MSQRTPYVHANINYFTNKIRLAIKDEQYGRITREQLAEILRERAIQIEQRIVPDQPGFFDDDPVVNVKAHLRNQGMTV